MGAACTCAKNVIEPREAPAHRDSAQRPATTTTTTARGHHNNQGGVGAFASTASPPIVGASVSGGSGVGSSADLSSHPIGLVSSPHEHDNHSNPDTRTLMRHPSSAQHQRPPHGAFVPPTAIIGPPSTTIQHDGMGMGSTGFVDAHPAAAAAILLPGGVGPGRGSGFVGGERDHDEAPPLMRVPSTSTGSMLSAASSARLTMTVGDDEDPHAHRFSYEPATHPPTRHSPVPPSSSDAVLHIHHPHSHTHTSYSTYPGVARLLPSDPGYGTSLGGGGASSSSSGMGGSSGSGRKAMRGVPSTSQSVVTERDIISPSSVVHLTTGTTASIQSHPHSHAHPHAHPHAPEVSHNHVYSHSRVSASSQSGSGGTVAPGAAAAAATTSAAGGGGGGSSSARPVGGVLVHRTSISQDDWELGNAKSLRDVTERQGEQSLQAGNPPRITALGLLRSLSQPKEKKRAKTNGGSLPTPIIVTSPSPTSPSFRSSDNSASPLPSPSPAVVASVTASAFASPMSHITSARIDSALSSSSSPEPSPNPMSGDVTPAAVVLHHYASPPSSFPSSGVTPRSSSRSLTGGGGSGSSGTGSGVVSPGNEVHVHRHPVEVHAPYARAHAAAVAVAVVAAAGGGGGGGGGGGEGGERSMTIAEPQPFASISRATTDNLSPTDPAPPAAHDYVVT